MEIAPVNSSESLVFKFWTLIRVCNSIVDDDGSSEFGDITRQLRVILSEMLRRNLFADESLAGRPTFELRTFYEFIKQYIEGVNVGKFEEIENMEEQYRTVIQLLKNRGEEMPAQTVEVKHIDFMSEALAQTEG
jgi:hypothetical protein